MGDIINILSEAAEKSGITAKYTLFRDAGCKIYTKRAVLCTQLCFLFL